VAWLLQRCRAYGAWKSARGLRNTPESIATPSGKKNGKYLIFNSLFKIPIWNLEASASLAVLVTRLIFQARLRRQWRLNNIDAFVSENVQNAIPICIVRDSHLRNLTGWQTTPYRKF
jgi:hypothetical protein